MAQPLQLSLVCKKAVILAGQEPEIEIVIQVHSDLEMETVELNQQRTAIHIRSVDTGETIVLTGTDHIAYQQVHPMAGVGSTFEAHGSDRWQVPLHLLTYRAPLAAGRYALSLSYRYGAVAAETVRTDEAEFTVQPATFLSASYRWMGGTNAWNSLESIWRVPGKWFYQVANAKNPAAVQSVVDLGVAVDAQPLLALINDLAGNHFERYAVWLEPGYVVYQRISIQGPLAAPERALHGLTGDVRLVDPPLQLPNGGCAIVLTGTDPAVGPCACLLHTVTGKWIATPLGTAAPTQAVVAWPMDDSAPTLYWATTAALVNAIPLRKSATRTQLPAEQRVLELACEQWLGQGRVLALLENGTELQLWQRALEPDAPPETNPIFDLDRIPWSVELPASFCPLPGEADAAVLYESPDAWVVLHAEQMFRFPKVAGRTGARIICTPRRGVWLVEFAANEGFVARRLGPPEPPPAI